MFNNRKDKRARERKKKSSSIPITQDSRKTEQAGKQLERGVVLTARCKHTGKIYGSGYKDPDETFNTLCCTNPKAAKTTE